MPFAITSLNDSVYATFAGSGNRTAIYRFQKEKWGRLGTPPLKSVHVLTSFHDRLLAGEVEHPRTLYLFDSEGATVASFPLSTMNVICGAKWFLTYESSKIEVRDEDGAIERELELDDALKVIFNEWMDVRCITHAGDDKFLLFIAGRHDQNGAGHLYEFDAATLKLTRHALSDQLKLKQNISKMEVAADGKLWLRRFGARTSSFSVIDSKGKVTDIKNK